MLPLEAVPNFSAGRDRVTIDALSEALSAHAELLDIHADADHNRSVFTLVGEDDAVCEALVAAVEVARRRIDLRAHEGAHPRIGAADVVPVVPLRVDDMARARASALRVAERIGGELGLPVFLYGEIGAARGPAFFRRGGVAELERRLAEGEVRPDYGPSALDPAAGGVLVGARPPLVAYNVDLATDDIAVADALARSVRESGGGMRGVQAIGLRLPQARRTQVSMNVLDLEASPLHEVVERVTREARALGVEVAGGELVGLVPARVLEAAERAGVVVPGVHESHVLERVLERASL
jgi:glutamate formiminotransferase